MFLFGAQLSGNFIKIAFFKYAAKIGFFKFLCFKFKFWKLSFLGLLKHYKTRGFRAFLGFSCWKRRKRPKRMITGISYFGRFWSTNGRFVTQICFPRNGLLRPLFLIAFFGGTLFGPSGQKREILDTRAKNLTDNWKAPFLVFLCVLLFIFLFSFMMFVLFCLFGFSFLGRV